VRGHLASSTLHANDAVGGITRSLDVIVELFLLAMPDFRRHGNFAAERLAGGRAWENNHRRSRARYATDEGMAETTEEAEPVRAG
jgi:hypothetical protein